MKKGLIISIIIGSITTIAVDTKVDTNVDTLTSTSVEANAYETVTVTDSLSMTQTMPQTMAFDMHCNIGYGDASETVTDSLSMTQTMPQTMAFDMHCNIGYGDASETAAANMPASATETTTAAETAAANMNYNPDVTVTTTTTNTVYGADTSITTSSNMTYSTEAAYPAQTPGVYFQFKGKNSGKCLKVKEHTNEDEAVLIIEDCTNNNNSIFTYNPYTQEIMVKRSHKCVDIKNGGLENGDIIRANPCNFAPTQRWMYDNGMIKNMGSGKCINVSDDSKENGAYIVQWDCSIFSGNMIWSIV
jgi:hypothetical protein